MTEDATQITGDQTLNMCKMEAAYLCKLIYRRPAGTNTFSTSFPQEIIETAEDWDEWKDFDFQKRCGLVQRLYKPKDYKPDAKNDEAMCWPALIHRGTDFDDFRGLGIAVSLHWPELSDALQNWKKRMSERRAEIQRPAKERNKKRVEDYLNNNDAMREPLEQESLPRGLGDDTGAIDSIVFDELNFEFEDGYLFKFEQWLDVKEKDTEKQKELSKINWVDAEIRKQATFSDYATGVFSKIGGKPTLDIKVVTRKEGPQGDWAANLLQGMGQIPDAYDLAMKNALTVSRDYIKPTQDQRLLIAGHSLGGGLAAAADCVFRYYANDTKMQSYAIGFNPAGIHDNTKEEAKKIAGKDNGQQTTSESKQNSKTSNGLMDIYYVEGEILTTMAWDPGQIPFALGALNIVNEHLPEPMGSRISLKPSWPGFTYDHINSPSDKIPVFGPKNNDSAYDFAKLPFTRLFPINEYKDMYGSNPFEVLLSLSGILNKYSVSGDSFQSVFGQFLNDIIDYIDKKFCGGSLNIILQNLNVDDDVVWKAIKKMRSDNTWDAILIGLGLGYGKGLLGIIKWEIDTLIRILSWSAEFHGMDYVIAALQNKIGIRKRIPFQDIIDATTLPGSD